MVIHADIKRIEDHLSILHEELREMQILSECLNNWYRRTPNDMVENKAMILKQLNYVHKQEANIWRRILLLEKTADRFLTLNGDIKDKLDSTIRLLQNLDGNTYSI